MKNRVTKIISIFLCSALLFASLFCYASCEKPTPDGDSTFTDEDFICVKGDELCLDKGNGESILLKGTNAGGYLVIEQWMCAFRNSAQTGYLDHKTVTEVFTQRFGVEKTLELWEFYRDNFWTESDFENCAEMGMNVIRLPFSYMSVDPDYNNVVAIEGQKYNFSILDEFVASAAKYGIYTILDLHGAYGSQNGKDHSGEIISESVGVDFYSNEEKMSKTADLWAAIAEHFEGNPAVAAYDLLNEPGDFSGSTSLRHWQFYDMLYDAVREKDEDHVIIMESCWDGINLPTPQEYGWTNCVYSFHNYSGTSDPDENLNSMRLKISGVESCNFDVPYYMGEFNCYGNEESWRKTLELFEDAEWSWTCWTYKLNLRSETAYRGWGIYYTYATPVVPDEDSFEDIKTKWKSIKTDDYYTNSRMTFSSGNTLYDLLAEFF